MWDETEALRLRVDTGGFAREVEGMRSSLEGSLAVGAERAGRAVETALLRAVRSGKLGFDDLKSTALSALAAIAAAALKASASGGDDGGDGGSLASALSSLAGGQPGRATGGPVSPGRAYVVGERGPELFVPTASGRVEASASGSAAREVRVAITINAPAGSAPEAMRRSGRQMARAVRAALGEG